MPTLPQNYLHDRLVLLLLSVNSFLTLIGTILVLLRLGAGRSSGYVVQYRANLGISAFKTGKALDLLAFIVFLVLVFVINLVLSIRIYSSYRNYAVTVLALGTLLSVLAIIVSNALLVLR